jgi:isopenicillin-N epimerase
MEFARHWGLDRSIRFLNHGSFGACPLPVLDQQRALRERMERQPVQFFLRDLEPLLDAARSDLAAFVNADPAEIAFVPNASTGVNAVLRSPDLRDAEILVTDHAYPACRNTVDFVTSRVAVAKIPFPIRSEDEIVGPILEAVTPRTRLALIDHVTSPTALVFPVARIVKELAARGVDTLVDGAHAPGMVPVDLRAIGAAYYVANCHKWLCSPKGAGFLHAARPVRPAVISHGATATVPGRSRFRLEFDWTGTADPTPALCVPAAIRFVGSLVPGGWPEVMERNRRLALEARRILGAAPCPDSMIGSMASIPIPDADPGPKTSLHSTDPLQTELLEKHRVEVPVFPWPAPPKRLVRVSAQLYNSPEEYALLARALRELL